MTLTPSDLPPYSAFILPSIDAVAALGGSASTREIRERVLESIPNVEELAAVVYPNNPERPVLVDRVNWGRTYARLVGALENPTRGLYLITGLGRELLTLPAEQAEERIGELDRAYRQSKQRRSTQVGAAGESAGEEVADSGDDAWVADLLDRLHELSPAGFEEFVLYMLRSYGLELRRVGGTGDEGIDGIGTAPLSPVLTTRVAVQVKRYAPDGRAVGREAVALLRADAQAQGAERAIFVTLGRFTEAARKAATVHTPNIDLIDGERLAELVGAQRLGVRETLSVQRDWFDRFDG